MRLILSPTYVSADDAKISEIENDGKTHFCSKISHNNQPPSIQPFSILA